MPLSEPVSRRHLHTRSVTCKGFLRDDDLWDIEAHLVDTKSYGFDNRDRGGRIEAGEAVHDLRLRVTLDLDFMIHAVEAASDQTPFNICSAATDSMQGIVGMTIGPGWMKRVRKSIGTRSSCTHLVEMLTHIATTAYQTMHYALEARASEAPTPAKPKILDTCVALASDSPVVEREWPDFYTGAAERE